MRKISILLTSAMFTVACMGSAAAQDTKAAPAAAASIPAVPKHGCKRPDKPAESANTATQRAFRRDVDGYRECLMSYGEDMRASAKSHMDAGNAAIQEFNDFVDTVQPKKDK